MPVTPATFTPENVTMNALMQGTVPAERGQEIIQDIMSQSLIMQLAKYEEMTSDKKTIDVFLGGMNAYWVGEGQRIQTTKPTWAQATLQAHKVATIIPVTREHLHYTNKRFFELYRPAMAEALYKKIDAATIMNLDNPFAWSAMGSATTAENIVGDTLDVATYDALVSALNDNGYEPNALVSKTANKSILRGLIRNQDGLNERVYDGTALDGTPVFDLHRDIEAPKGTLVAGDFNQAFYGIPYGIEYKISEDATLTTIVGDDGQPVNLFERDMVAMRVIMDIAFMIIDDKAFAAIQPAEVPGV